MELHKKKLLNKLCSWEEAAIKVQEWQQAGKKVVFTNGCFDIIHPGHVTYLAEAADLGDHLVLGLNTDASVKRLGKSASRPIQSEEARARVISALESVALVVLFNEDTPLELIQRLQPDILVKGADYQIDQIVGAKEVLERGGAVKTLQFLEGYSTSAIERKILESGK